MAIDEKVLIERLENKQKEAQGEGLLSYAMGFRSAKLIVKDLAEEHNNGWIPCNERFPEIGQIVLVSVAEEKILRNEIILMEYCEALKHMFEDGSILAWQPLPAPYRKGE